MTVWIYVDTREEVGDKDHLKVFGQSGLAETWFEENDPEGVGLTGQAWTLRPHLAAPTLRPAGCLGGVGAFDRIRASPRPQRNKSRNANDNAGQHEPRALLFQRA